ncbi:MAG: membrane protein FxsA [bacterium]|nr:membrane protein FxsA [bacterium]
MFVNLLLLFTIVPVVELYILVKVGGEIGTLNTIGIVILTGIIGAAFAKSQGIQLIRRIQLSLSQGKMPGQELLHGAMVLAGGIMLITPGFLTDLVGFSLLIPLTRTFYAGLGMKYFKKKFQSGQWQYHNASSHESYLDDEEPPYREEDFPGLDDKS